MSTSTKKKGASKRTAKWEIKRHDSGVHPVFGFDGYWARFKAANGEIFVCTEIYRKKASAYNAIRVLSQHAAHAPVVDLSKGARK